MRFREKEMKVGFFVCSGVGISMMMGGWNEDIGSFGETRKENSTLKEGKHAFGLLTLPKN